MKLHTFKGSRYNIGCQLGRTFQESVQAGCRDVLNEPPPMSSSDRIQSLLVAHKLIEHELPDVMTELRGIADGAQVRVMDLILSLYEDLWDSEDFETGCTDIAANQVGSLNNELLMGHNNDEGCEAPSPVLLRMEPDDGPVVTGVALGGVGLSVGCNGHGLVLTGNQLSATDVKPGIPRILLVRAALDRMSIPEAQAVLLHPLRASSYNNILGDAFGRVVSIEGSGKAYRVMAPTQQGILTHTNHYLHPGMERVEGKGDMASTTLREQRSCTLMEGMSGRHTVQSFQRILRDHVGYPDSICRHSDDTVTGFSVIWEAERRTLWYAKGHPCKAVYQSLPY